MKNIDETSWITYDGMIWLQVIDLKSVKTILKENMFELFFVNISEQTERLIENEEELDLYFDKGDIVCIPVGKMTAITSGIIYKI